MEIAPAAGSEEILGIENCTHVSFYCIYNRLEQAKTGAQDVHDFLVSS
jgi:hypothetical protein